mgnify:CR=1 FL=1
MDNKGLSIKATLQKVEKALREIEHGEITITIQNGKPIFVENSKRERVG